MASHIRGGGQGGKPRSNESGMSTEGGKREDGRWDTQGGESQEKLEINFSTLRNFSQQKKHTEAGTTKEGGGNPEYKVG